MSCKRLSNSSAPQANFLESIDFDRVHFLLLVPTTSEDDRSSFEMIGFQVAWPKSITRARTFASPVLGHFPNASKIELSVNSTKFCFCMSSTIFSTSFESKSANVDASMSVFAGFKITFSNTSEILELVHRASFFQKNLSPDVMPSLCLKFFTSSEQYLQIDAGAPLTSTSTIDAS